MKQRRYRRVHCTSRVGRHDGVFARRGLYASNPPTIRRLEPHQTTHGASTGSSQPISFNSIRSAAIPHNHNVIRLLFMECSCSANEKRSRAGPKATTAWPHSWEQSAQNNRDVDVGANDSSQRRMRPSATKCATCAPPVDIRSTSDFDFLFVILAIHSLLESPAFRCSLVVSQSLPATKRCSNRGFLLRLLLLSASALT
jgi:hypothetical protein